MKAVVGTVIVGVFLIVGLFTMVVNGWWHQTETGTHTGYVTATEQTGFFFHPYSVYIKTNAQSSQEDKYCVIDPSLYAQLQKDSQTSAHITLSFVAYAGNGIKNCTSDATEIITSVQED